MDEQQHAHRPVGRQLELVEGLEALPGRDLGVGQVDQPRRDVRLHLLDGLLEQGRRHEPEDQRLRGALDECRAGRGRGGPWPAARAPARSGLHVDLEVSGLRARARAPWCAGRVDGEVPGVDAVALEQHDRVLVRRARRRSSFTVPGGCALGVRSLVRRGVRSTLSTRREVALLERRDEHVRAHGLGQRRPGSGRRLGRRMARALASYDAGVVTRTVPSAKSATCVLPPSSTGALCQPRAAAQAGRYLSSAAGLRPDQQWCELRSRACARPRRAPPCPSPGRSPCSSAWKSTICCWRAGSPAAEDAYGEQAGVAGVADRDRRDRDPGGHLHDGEQGVHPVEVLQRHRHADHRQRRDRGEHARAGGPLPRRRR